MSQRRTLILIAAIAIGALASFLVWQYVGGIQDQAYSDAERVKVYLVKQPISRGTPGNIAQASIVEESIPRKFKPANAIESLDDIAGQVAKSDLVANQVVVTDMFVEAGDPEAIVSAADQLPKIQDKDMTTFTVSVGPDNAVAGLIAPGDYVNVLVQRFSEVSANTTAGGSPDDASGGAQTVSGSQARYLYQKAQVLFVGTTSLKDATASADGTTAAPATGGSTQITLILPVEATQILASVPSGNIYFSLVSKDYEPKPTGDVDLSPLPAEDPGQLTPYGPEGARATD
ncbi:MAG TPA: Flp pilus assembly protein CpaB [Aquihabitans sp.]|nr:Flp pilus assembly protein CpaB [Aquihabitans sp.]